MSLEILIEFAPLAAVLVWCGVLLVLLRLRNRPAKFKLVDCNYIVFEAEPVNLANINADMAANGWHLAGSQRTATNALLYRFEKKVADATCLSKVYNFGDAMPRTVNRKTGVHSLIKIHSYGST